MQLVARYVSQVLIIVTGAENIEVMVSLVGLM